MYIAGLQKMTLLDYPGKVACTVFLQGCNFRCPFCHNSDLLPGQGEALMDQEAFLAFLKKRRGLLDAVCVSGGEPTLQPELEGLLRGIKDLGYSVKLDTNGSRPQVLQSLVARGLVDYVAMDVKNCPERYGQTVGLKKAELAAIEESLRFLLGDNVDYELRTTVVSEFHEPQDIVSMGQWLAQILPPKKPRKLFLQCFVNRESVLVEGLHPVDSVQMERYLQLLAPFVEIAQLRG